MTDVDSVEAYLERRDPITHRLRITEAAQFDESIGALLAEAYADVGPGTRGR